MFPLDGAVDSVWLAELRGRHLLAGSPGRGADHHRSGQGGRESGAETGPWSLLPPAQCAVLGLAGGGAEPALRLCQGSRVLCPARSWPCCPVVALGGGLKAMQLLLP